MPEYTKEEHEEVSQMLNSQLTEEKAEWDEQAKDIANLLEDLLETKVPLKVLAEPDIDAFGKIMRKLDHLYHARRAILFTENEIKMHKKVVPTDA